MNKYIKILGMEKLTITDIHITYTVHIRQT